jgi:CheY-like chemotaxis protein
MTRGCPQAFERDTAFSRELRGRVMSGPPALRTLRGMTQRRSNPRRRRTTSAAGGACPPRVPGPYRRRGGVEGVTATALGAAEPERPLPHERATAQRSVIATLRAIFLLAGMCPAGPAAMLTVMALRCLIVDDNAGFLRSARLLLQREGVDVVAIASDGDEARRQTAEFRPDVVLLDVDLGTESGFEVAGRLHADPGPSPPDLIMISIHGEEDLADLIAASPAVGFIGKPHLSAQAIRDLLDRPRGT